MLPIRSAATSCGQSACAIAIVAMHNSGVSARIADTRDASQCAKASAKAPYAAIVFAAQYSTNATCSGSSASSARGCANGVSASAANT